MQPAPGFFRYADIPKEPLGESPDKAAVRS